MSNKRLRTDKALFYADSISNFLAENGNFIEHAPAIKKTETTLLAAAWLAVREVFLCWVSELAEVSNVQGFDDANFSVEAFLREEYARYPEFQYLRNVKETPNSWLYNLVFMTRVPGLVGEKLSERANNAQGNHSKTVHRPENGRISIVNVEEASTSSLHGSTRDPIEQFMLTFGELKSAIASARERQIEW